MDHLKNKFGDFKNIFKNEDKGKLPCLHFYANCFGGINVFNQDEIIFAVSPKLKLITNAVNYTRNQTIIHSKESVEMLS